MCELFIYKKLPTYYDKNIVGGVDVPKLEPKTTFRRFTFWTLDPIIKNLRHIYKEHPEWFETPKQKSDKGKNVVDYSIK